jgi:hypothetical protein
MPMRSQPYSLSVQLRLAAMRHGRGGHSSETAAARERKEAIKASRQRASLMGERHSQRSASSGRLAVGRNSLISLCVMGLAVTSERIFHQHRPVRLLRKLPPVTSAD